LAKGTVFVFQLTVPLQEEPFRIRGTVVWINDGTDPDQPGDEAGMGIEFLYDDDSERIVFEDTVEELMRESLGDLLYTKLMERSRNAE
jgi:type IV pilus assembly protein PilZ